MCFYCVSAVVAQISYGGMPLLLGNSPLRNSSMLEFIEMPSFNLDSVKQMDELNRQNMRTSFQFAYKFYTHIEKGKEGNSHVLSNGTKVWQVGIYSKGAYSINLLFTKFHLPEGGKLFIYNANHTHIIGAFDHRNNSPEQILPVRPVAGDAIIIEYSEPANATFEGQLIIGEVNHDYRGILNEAEPATDHPTSFSCMPDVLCKDVDEKIIRSTVLLIINGTISCTGSLINNTKNDETPYLLTAVHCLDIDVNFPHEPAYYIQKAGSIVAFFNYNRPVCGTQMKATEEMSLAGANPMAIIEQKDVALMEFKEKPPVHYNAYYAGWNMDAGTYLYPYTNIHHPNAAVKKYGMSNQNLYWTNRDLYPFDKSYFMEIAWDEGSTHEGSSGSPLFDKDNLIVGTLTAGDSRCNNNLKDYFAALYLSWNQPEENNIPYLKQYLDPSNTNSLRQNGYDPYAQNPLVRVSNANYNQGDKLINTVLEAPNSGFMFGNNSLNITEFAEEFNLEKPSEILGVYIFIPKMPFAYTAGVDIEIYEGNSSPEIMKANKLFIPQYRDYSTLSSSFQSLNKNTNLVSTESFIAFDSPVKVGKKFFVAYKINPSQENHFSIYNTQFASSTNNTAWLKSSQWIKASEFTVQSLSTSLALQPLIRYVNDSSIENTKKEKNKYIHYERSTNQLFFIFDPESAGKILVYSVSGQLIEEILFSKGEKSFQLSPLRQGSVGIIKVFNENRVISEKIIF